VRALAEDGFGPFRLRALDTFVALNAMRLLYGQPRTRLMFRFSLVVGLVCLIEGLILREWVLFGVGLGLIAYFFILGPLSHASTIKPYTLHFVPDGLISLTDDEETLYRSLDLTGRKTIRSRLLIESGGLKVLIVPLRQLPRDQLERFFAALDRLTQASR